MQNWPSHIWSSFAARKCLSVFTRFPPGGDDLQHPHYADEVYIALGGQAALEIEGEDHEVSAGSIVSVDRGREHKFREVTDDLSVLVVFAPPESPDS
jgi:mannose-6-phosphate isomerase-like protein (cupin superfamily)